MLWLNPNAYTVLYRSLSCICFTKWSQIIHFKCWKQRKQKIELRFAFNDSYGSYFYSFRCTRLSVRFYSFPIIEKISTIPFFFLLARFVRKLLNISFYGTLSTRWSRDCANKFHWFVYLSNFMSVCEQLFPEKMYGQYIKSKKFVFHQFCPFKNCELN